MTGDRCPFICISFCPSSNLERNIPLRYRHRERMSDRATQLDVRPHKLHADLQQHATLSPFSECVDSNPLLQQLRWFAFRLGTLSSFLFIPFCFLILHLSNTWYSQLVQLHTALALDVKLITWSAHWVRC